MSTNYRIKPLVWEPFYGGGAKASTIVGDFFVRRYLGGGWAWDGFIFDGDEGRSTPTHSCESLDEGKRAVEAFYLERLLPALEVIA